MIDPNDPRNFYNYNWTSLEENLAALNWVMLSTLGILVIASVILLAKTKMLKFITFFLTGQVYKNMQLNMTVQTKEQDESVQNMSSHNAAQTFSKENE